MLYKEANKCSTKRLTNALQNTQHRLRGPLTRSRATEGGDDLGKPGPHVLAARRRIEQVQRFASEILRGRLVLDVFRNNRLVRQQVRHGEKFHLHNALRDLISAPR